MPSSRAPPTPSEYIIRVLDVDLCPLRVAEEDLFRRNPSESREARVICCVRLFDDLKRERGRLSPSLSDVVGSADALRRDTLSPSE